MGFSWDIDRWDRNKIIAAILIVYLITRIPFLTALPLMRDEGMYSIMIEEQIAHPTAVVTFLNQPVAWKPPLMFWTYGAFVKYLRGLPVPLEVVYRFPGFVFGLANALLVFLIFERVLKDKKLAFLGSLAYLGLFIPVHTDSRVLTDTLCGTFIFAGILAYMIGLEKRGYFLAGGLFTFLAYMVKQTNAATVPVLALALLFEKDRKKLLDPLFLISLIGFPLAMWLFNTSAGWGGSPAGDTTYILQNYLVGRFNVDRIVESLLTFFPMAVIWFPLSLFGFAKNWKGNLMMSAWFLLTIFPLISGSLMPFYYYPVMPAIAFFALQLLMRNETGAIVTDRFFYIIFFTLAISGFLYGAYNHLWYYHVYIPEKQAGEFLAGKENVLIIGDYAPSIPAYKMLEENRINGKWLDYGWVMIPETNLSADIFYSFISDYNTDPPYLNVSDGDFRGLFAEDRIFKKNTTIKKFDYIAVVGNSTVRPKGNLVLNNSFVQVYDVRK